MRHQFLCQFEHVRIAVSGSEPRHDSRIVARQITANLGDMRVDEISVFEEPFSSGGQRMIQSRRFRQVAAGGFERHLVIPQAGEDPQPLFACLASPFGVLSGKVFQAAGPRGLGLRFNGLRDRRVLAQHEDRRRAGTAQQFDDGVHLFRRGFGHHQVFAIQAKRGVAPAELPCGRDGGAVRAEQTHAPPRRCTNRFVSFLGIPLFRRVKAENRAD